MSENPNAEHFEAMYQNTPPWDIGRPQDEFVKIADQIQGTILDAGCGTGDNALFFAERGHTVLGIDFLDSPLEQARRKAEQRRITVEFRRWDALALQQLDRVFDSVIDCGLFHTFSDEDRVGYVEALKHVTRLGSRVFVLCFSDEEPDGEGPRRVSRQELESAFVDGWTVESITAARFVPNPTSEHFFSAGGPKAWLAVSLRDR